jgi:hypothetical protein
MIPLPLIKLLQNHLLPFKGYYVVIERKKLVMHDNACILNASKAKGARGYIPYDPIGMEF